MPNIRPRSHFRLTATATTAIALLAAGSAFADQNQQPSQAGQPKQAQQEGQKIADVQQGTVSDRELQQGWSADQTLDMSVVSAKTGEEIGSAENLIVDQNGKVVALVAQIGGFLDIGDRHVAVPWDEVTRKQNQLTVPITEENIGEYSLFKDPYFNKPADIGKITTVDESLQTGPKTWQVSNLLNDYAVLENGEGYGYVDDLIFSQDNQLLSVVVSATEVGTPGYYAYPWYGFNYGTYSWDPGLGYYALPYGPTGVSEFAAFEYNDMFYP